MFDLFGNRKSLKDMMNELDEMLGSVNQEFSSMFNEESLIKEGSDENKIERAITLPTNVLSNLMVNKFNSKYNDLDESTKKIIKVSLNGGEKEKSELFNLTCQP